MNKASAPATLDRAETLIAKGALAQAHALCLETLAREPLDTRALFLMGLIASERRSFKDAVTFFERAGAQGEVRDARLAAHHAKALAFLHRLDEARRRAEQAAALGPTDALTLDTIGVVFSRAGMHERALGFFAQAAALTPDVASFQYNLAASQQFSGRFEEAEASYRKAYALDPRADRALAAIPHLRRQTPDNNLIPELKAAFAAAGEHEERRLRLGHALAKTYDDLDQPTEAMRWLDEAKRLSRTRLSAAEARDQAVFAAAARTAAPAQRPGFQNTEPVFIVGLPRTGTTLTDRVLSSHPEVFSAGELGNFGLIVKRAAGGASRFVLDAEAFERALNLEPAALGEAYIKSTRPATGHSARFTDKMPLNFFYAGLIHRALPQAKIICLRRNPMDSCLSNYRQLLATGPSSYDYTLELGATARYYARFERLVAHWREHLPASAFTEVWYEDLVSDLEREARRLVGFIGLDWDPACLAFHENAAPVATASSVQVRSPLYKSAVGRWRRYGEALEPLRAALEQTGVKIEN